MKVYVAGKFQDKETVRKVQTILRCNGYTITCDWTGNTAEGLYTNEKLAYERASAIEDVEGVRNADFVILVAHPELRGALVEMGMALALGKPVLVLQVGNTEMPFNVFLRHPLVRVYSIIDLFGLRQMLPTFFADVGGTEAE